MELQYGNACLSLQQVHEWSRKFKNGMSSVTDTPRPGQAHRVVTPQAISEVERVIRESCRDMVDEVAAMLDISHGSAHHIIHYVLQFNKVSARWVPRQLTHELKERHVDACQERLRRYETEGDGFLQRIVTVNESWVHHFQPETKKASKEWRHSSSPKPKKFRTQASAGKVMLTLFWDHRDPLVKHYMSKGTTVTSATYCDLLRNHLNQQSDQNVVDCSVLVSCCSITTLGLILPVRP
jgi:histone-lysine N-methyltransferase SETMAR